MPNPEHLPPKPPTPPGPDPSASTQRCGKDWNDANSNCHNACSGPQDCDSAKFGTNGCYGQLDQCKSNIADQQSKLQLANKLFG
jgi:hypothetical protein